MDNLPIFDVLANALTQGALSRLCVVEMDGEAFDVRCVYVRRQIPVETDEGLVYVSAAVTISLALRDLPRRPKIGDRIELQDTVYEPTGASVELGNGMIECPVRLVANP